MTRLFLSSLLALALMLSAWAQPARIAIVSDASARDLAALVTTELSSNPSVMLVERDDFAKIGDEAKVQQMAGADATALGKLLSADGLVFLNSDAAGLHCRLTAVGLGYVLFDLPVPKETPPPALAKAIAERVTMFVPKLTLPLGKAVPVALLNLRSELASDAQQERSLTLLLESRLAAIPEYVVLERRHADALGFEHSIQAPGTPSLASGTWLIDGSFAPTRSGTGARMSVKLRLRSTNSDRQAVVQQDGSSDELPGLVDKLVSQIEKQIGSQTTAAGWDPKKEARDYLREGLWAWRNELPDTALEALDDAEMLGETAPDLYLLRFAVLGDLARPDYPRFTPLEQQVPLVHRGLQDYMTFNVHSHEPRQVVRDDDEPVYELRDEFLKIADGVLTNLEAKSETTLADSIRQDLRQADHFDPLNGKAPWVKNPDDLCVSLNEEMAYYLIGAVRNMITPNPAWFAPRFLKTPEERREAFNQYMERLQAEPKGRLPWLLLKCLYGDTAACDTYYPQFLDELWRRRDDVLTNVNGLRYEKSISYATKPELRQKYSHEALPIVLYSLRCRSLESISYLAETWNLSWFSPGDAEQIWNVIQEQKAISPGDDNHQRDIADYEKEYFKAFPLRAPPSRGDTTQPLIVSRLWYGRKIDDPNGEPDLVGGTNARITVIWQSDSDPQSDDLWMMILRYDAGPFALGLVRVHLPDLSTQYLEAPLPNLPNGSQPQGMAQTSKAIYFSYIIYSDTGTGETEDYHLMRYDRATATWADRRISATNESRLYAFNDELYVGADYASLSRYDWDTDRLTVLASARRRPAQNQFDDASSGDLPCGYLPILGPNHKVYLRRPEGLYEIQEKPGLWPLFPFDCAGNVFHFGGIPRGDFTPQTLLVSLGGEVVLIDPDRPAPLPLMAPTIPSDWYPVPGSSLRQKRLPSWASQAVWRYDPAWGEVGPIAYHSGSLYRLSRPPWGAPASGYRLFVFAPGHRTPVVIPLNFLYGGSREATDKIMKWCRYMDFTERASRSGISLINTSCVWYIPYTDIEPYLQRAAAAAHETGPQPSSPPMAEADANPNSGTPVRSR